MTTVIWIDWYSYHISRLRALVEHSSLRKEVVGIELVGGCGVHTGLRFRDSDRAGLPIQTLFPNADWKQISQWQLARALWKKLDELKPSSVLVPGWYTVPAIAAALWCKAHRKRSVLMSETTAHDHSRVWWKEGCKSILIRSLFDRGVVGGKPHARYLKQLGFKASKLGKYYDVVDNNFFGTGVETSRKDRERRERLKLPENYFLYVGRLAPEKNLSLCLDAFSFYRKHGGRWSLVLAGDGPERTSLERRAQELGIDDFVSFAGLKTSKELADYYAFAKCFVLPSIREPWGLVVNEAMASGLPVLISSSCGCSEDLIEPGANGFIFDPLDAAELSELMLRINNLSAVALDEMRQRSRDFIAEYSPENWASEVVRLVRSEGQLECASCS